MRHLIILQVIKVSNSSWVTYFIYILDSKASPKDSLYALHTLKCMQKKENLQQQHKKRTGKQSKPKTV